MHASTKHRAWRAKVVKVKCPLVSVDLFHHERTVVPSRAYNFTLTIKSADGGILC